MRGKRDMSELLGRDLKFECWPRCVSKGVTTGKLESGIKVTHLPTGKTAACTVYRLQYKNKEEAIKLLKQQLATHTTNKG